MSLKQKILKARRDHWRDRVLSIGVRLNALYRRRSALDPYLNSELIEDVALLDADIKRLERKRDGYLDNIRRTA